MHNNFIKDKEIYTMNIKNEQTSKLITDYLNFCISRKNLDQKTIKSYKIDLRQYFEFTTKSAIKWTDKKSIEQYIDLLHYKYKPKSVKRKIASLKAFFHYLEIEELIEINPFHKMQIKYKEPFILPKTIPINNIEQIIRYAYLQLAKANTEYTKKVTLRNTLILELLFATGMRISELCTLTAEQIDFNDYIIKIYGKGSKERLIQICNQNVQAIIKKYYETYRLGTESNNYFFINRLSEQSVRNMINNYAIGAKIPIHITPHMFRHSFATLLLEEDVDIRYIQQMLGHSSITTTQIYTHTSINKQKSILSAKHPRNKLEIYI